MTALARTLLLTLALILPAAAPATAADASADSADAAAAAPIGFIKTLSGEVHVDADADGRGTQRAHIGMAVHLGQTLRTAADASVGLILRDDTTLTLGPAIAETLAHRAAPDVSIVGHTDTVGDAERNQVLALERARIVQQALAELLKDAVAVEVTSHGERNPVVPTADEMDEPRNRRVDITIR